MAAEFPHVLMVSPSGKLLYVHLLFTGRQFAYASDLILGVQPTGAWLKQ